MPSTMKTGTYSGSRCWVHTLEMQIPLLMRAMSSVVFRKEFLRVKFRGLKKNLKPKLLFGKCRIAFSSDRE